MFLKKAGQYTSSDGAWAEKPRKDFFIFYTSKNCRDSVIEDAVGQWWRWRWWLEGLGRGSPDLIVRDVSVDFQRDRHAFVTQCLTDDIDVNLAPQGERGVGMPQIMAGDVRQFAATHNDALEVSPLLKWNANPCLVRGDSIWIRPGDD